MTALKVWIPTNVSVAYFSVMFVYGLRLKHCTEYRYVGITSKGVEARFNQHLRASMPDYTGQSFLVHRWIAKHRESIVYDILEDLTGESREYLTASEVLWIFALKFLGNRLLNLTDGGDGMVGPMVNRNKFKTGPENPNYGGGKGHPAYGRVVSEYERNKARLRMTGAGNPNYGKVYTDEEKLKRSLETKGTPRPKSSRSAHTRYHTNKGTTSPKTCKYCREESEKDE